MNRDNFANWAPNEKGIEQLPEKVREYVVFLQETNSGLVARITELKKQRGMLARKCIMDLI